MSDIEGTKPVIIVGTHADCMSKGERKARTEEMELQFPTPTTWVRTRNQILGHFALSLVPGEKKGGLHELKARLLEIAHSHPKIAVGKILVPIDLVSVQKELDAIKQKSPYMAWQDYALLGASLGITPPLPAHFMV